MIGPFTGKYYFLSNFYPATVVLDGVVYPSVEHAFQAAKTHDLAMRDKIRTAPMPSAAKRLGRRVNLRSDWDTMRVAIMTDLVRQKFRHPELAEKLLATGDEELVEVNTWGDQFWGVDGIGKNMLGQILMSVRSELRKQPLRIYTAQMSKSKLPMHVDALGQRVAFDHKRCLAWIDTTVKGTHPFWAPTWDLVMGLKHGTITTQEYTAQYLEHLDKGADRMPDRWLHIIRNCHDKGWSIVLLCFCPPDGFCHRFLLAERLVRFCAENGIAAEYAGEWAE